MTNTKTILALKPYLEEVERGCQKLTHVQLCQVIDEIARDVAPRQRIEFLQRLQSHNPDEPTLRAINVDDELLERILVLKEEISARQESIEDGTYYEEYGDDDSYYDDDVEALSDEQQEELAILFAETDHLFLAGELELAEKAYRALLELFGAVGDEDQEDEFAFYYSLSESDVQINWRETRARFCRCVYEMHPPEERVAHMIRAMELHVNLYESRYTAAEGNYPLLQDVFDAKTGELPGWDAFLHAWCSTLEKMANNRASVLLLEAIKWQEGIAGVAREVRDQQLPVGYLFWLELLCSQQDWHEAGLIAQEALQNMPKGMLRAQAAEILSIAGTKIDDKAWLLQGTREGFFSMPERSRLALLVEEACQQDVRNDELEKALHVLSTQTYAAHVQLRIHVLLMLGQLDKAVSLVDTEKELGWSYGGTGIGIVFGGLLTALTHADTQGITIQSLLKRYVGTAYHHSTYGTTQDSATDDPILREILQGLQHIPAEETSRKARFTLARKMGEKRIDGIVSNKHRNAYARAAEVLGALIECCVLNERQTEAHALLETYRNQKYRRHSAFRKELDTVLRKSSLLKTYYSKK